jgi:hypothetical protein
MIRSRLRRASARMGRPVSVIAQQVSASIDNRTGPALPAGA